MFKELRLHPPALTSHPDIALPMSIMATIPYLDNWLCSEFLQLYSNGIYTKRYNYGSCEEYEPLECIRIPYRLDFGEDIIDFFVQAIKNNYYVLVFCDDSRIQTMKIKYPRLHGILLFGFDQSKHFFYAYAYNGVKLERFKVSFDDMISAYNSDFSVQFHGRGSIFDELSNNHEIRGINMESHMIVLYKLKQSTYENYKINLDKIKWHMLDYLESVDTLSRERPHFGEEVIAWGLDVYEGIKPYYRYQSEQHDAINFADPYCIYEHKKDWLRKLRYIHDHTELKCSEDIFNCLTDLIRHAEIFINLIVKYNVNYLGDTKEIMDRIFHQMDVMREIEKRTLNEYYDLNRTVFESF